MAVEIGKTYQSRNCGEFVVIGKAEKQKGSKKTYYHVKFSYTGYETTTRYDTIESGQVNDPFYPNKHGVGYIGVPNGSDIDLSMRDRWDRMLSRCYNIDDAHYIFYGGAGVTVCERWLCYVNFVEDCKTLPGYKEMVNNPHIKYHLDKDILQQGIPVNQKVYSPETCMFVPACQNSYQVAIDHFDERGNKYFNVEEHYNAYNVKIEVDGLLRRIGRYKDPIVAANAANHARHRYGLPILNTDVPYIPPEIVNSLNIRTVRNDMVRKNEMVKIINK
jgi:hypothetical protein